MVLTPSLMIVVVLADGGVFDRRGFSAGFGGPMAFAGKTRRPSTRKENHPPDERWRIQGNSFRSR